MYIKDRSIKKLKGKSRMWLVAVMALLSLSTVSCTEDAIDTGGSSVTPDGKVLVSLSLKIPLPEQVETRATTVQEDQISSLDIIVFDTSDKLSQAPASATLNSTTWKVALAPSTAEQKIYAIANLSALQRTTLEGLAIGSTFDAVRTALTRSDVTAAGVSHPFVMFSQVIQTAISPTMGAKQIELVRAIAKIDVTAATLATTDFVLESVTLLNAAKKYSPIPASVPELRTGADVIRYNPVTASGNSVASAIYCYENNSTASSPTQLLIKGRYNGATTSGYYLLNIVYNKNNAFHFEIKRNNKYTVNITKVNSPGFKSDTEALQAPPTNNMVAEVVVTDGDAHDIVSNGAYYLGLSNSECMIYSSESYTNELIATFTHNAPSWVGTGSVTVEGTGLTLSGANPFTTPNGSIQSGEVRVNVGMNFVLGYVTVRLGNLEKRIRVFRNARQLSYGGAFDLGEAYVYARKLQTGPSTSWIKLSPNEDESVKEDEVANPNGSVHMQLDINLKLLGGATRSCDLMCARSNYEGRVRVKVSQYAFDILDKGGQLNSAYAGTFHRWNEVGERIIKMNHPGTTVWVATVVTGQEFIKLALGGSADPLVGTDTWSDPEDDPVLGNATTIVGNNPTGDIIFRVGMKSTLQSADSEPRYGLILVTYSGGTHRILVRQGEKADYVFSPNDNWTNNTVYPNEKRPLAKKWLPYNLTDPKLSKGGSSITDHNILSVNDAVFNPQKLTKYPSQIGYMFFRNTRVDYFHYAQHPVNCMNVSGEGGRPAVSYKIMIDGTEPTYLNTQSKSAYKPEYDPCPAGYGYPRDHNLLNQDSNYANHTTSELRQSLAWGNADGTMIDLSTNSIYGYIADGFFDRLNIISSNIPGYINIGVDKTMVINGGIAGMQGKTITGNDIAMQGILIFNPINLRSIFLPAAGTLGLSSQYLNFAGGRGYYWTTSYSGNQFGAIWTDSGSITIQYSQGFYLPSYPVRCVKREP